MSLNSDERKLHEIESLTDGDKVRVLTRNKKSRIIDASSIGGKIMTVKTTFDADANAYVSDKTFGEIYDAVKAGTAAIIDIVMDNDPYYDETLVNVSAVSISGESGGEWAGYVYLYGENTMNVSGADKAEVMAAYPALYL